MTLRQQWAVRRLVSFFAAVPLAIHLWGWEIGLFVWMALGCLEPRP